MQTIREYRSNGMLLVRRPDLRAARSPLRRRVADDALRYEQNGARCERFKLPAELRAACFGARRPLDSNEQPNLVEFIDAVPQTALGKPGKKALRAKLGQRIG